ncbi:MAG: HAD hydrolase-like protein [Nanoarchaeota archaeon]|nr:HAD hydrolase-like protein [Nanoarchaeota archaeon]MBU1854139.1 HAD hydrolase-like protein [Nanoarchaeota archaeon]
MNQNTTEQNQNPIYQYLWTDVMGTTTPKKEEIKQVTDYLMNNTHVQEEASKRTGLDNIVEKYTLGNQSPKGSPEFNEMINIYDVAAEIGYESKEIQLKLYQDVTDTLKDVNEKEIPISVFGTGGAKGTKLGFEGAGIGYIVNKYHTAFKNGLGSKYDPETYKKIAIQEGVNLQTVAYITDEQPEVDAAVEAGVGSVFLIDRNAEREQKEGYSVINDYVQILE